MRSLLRLLALALVPLALGAGATPPPTTLSPRVRLAARLAQDAGRPDARAGLPSHLAPAVHTPAVPAGVHRGAAPGEVPNPACAPHAKTRLSVLIETEDPSALVTAGFAVRTIAGPVVTASVPLDRLAELAATDGVVKVELSLPLRPSLDVSMPEIHADDAHEADAPPYPDTGTTGRGVVVGVIDTGVDILHGDFRDETGDTRISWLWDQTDNGGPNPAGFTYGTEWSGADVDAGTARQRDDVGHGTHVAGIAAGNGRGASDPEDRYRYTGVAPEAEIIVVKAQLSEAQIVDAVSWVFERAAGKPCVVNLSIGSHSGPHDGTAPLDRALAGLSGPGRILVAAAGNEGGQEQHAAASLEPGGSVDIQLGIHPYVPLGLKNNDFLELEAWYAGAENLRFSVLTPGDIVTDAVARGEAKTIPTADGGVFMDHDRDPVNGDNLCLIQLYDHVAEQPPRAGIWKVRVENPSSRTVRVDLWVSFDALGAIGAGAFWASSVENAVLVDSPASSDSVIAVGAYVTKFQWSASDGKVYEYDGVGDDIIPGKVATWSSPGPRRDGIVKPDISAPGMGIASAKSAHGFGDFSDPRRTTPDLSHVLSQGTSQASPHVAGVVALVLQDHPELGVKEVLHRIRSSARTDPFTGTVPNGIYGYGKIDAAGAVDPPILITALTAAWEAGEVAVRWNMSLPAPGARFQVERGPAETGPFNGVSDVLSGESPFTWIDPDPDGAEPWYRVRATGADEATSFFGPVRLAPLASRPRLWQNAPNPVLDHTVVSFDLDRPQEARLDLYDVRGRWLATLFEGPLLEGRHVVDWYGLDAKGRRVSAGVYFYRLTTPGSALSRRLIVTR